MGERHGVESDTRPCSEPKLCLHALVWNNKPGMESPSGRMVGWEVNVSFWCINLPAHRLVAKQMTAGG